MKYFFHGLSAIYIIAIIFIFILGYWDFYVGKIAVAVLLGMLASSLIHVFTDKHKKE